MAKNTSLPKNRKQMFRRHVFSWELMSISLLTALFSFPLFALWSISSVAESEILQNLSQNAAETLTVLFQKQIQTCLIALPFCCLFAVGLSGACYYLRKLVWREIASVKTDFWAGVKKSFWQSVFSGVWMWLTICFVVLGSWMTLLYTPSGLFQTLMFLVIAAFAVVFFSATMFDITQNAVYKTTFFARMRNNLYFAATQFPKNLLVVVATLLPFALFAFLPYTTAVIAVATVYFVYGLGVATLLQTLYSHSVFDKFINRQNYPQLVNKGLDVEKKDESNN